MTDKKPILFTDTEGKPNGKGSIFHIPFETLKKTLEKDLLKPNAKPLKVIELYRKDYIIRALQISEVRGIYESKKHNRPDFRIPITMHDYLYLPSTKKAIDVLIEFEDYLNHIKETYIKEQPQPVEILDIKNNFDHVEITKVYEYFYKELVATNYLTDTQLKQYLKVSFEQQDKPNKRFTFNNNPQKGIIRNVFYRYYTNVAGKGRQGNYRAKCAELLGKYFIGYDTDIVLNNFNK